MGCWVLGVVVLTVGGGRDAMHRVSTGHRDSNHRDSNHRGKTAHFHNRHISQ